MKHLNLEADFKCDFEKSQKGSIWPFSAGNWIVPKNFRLDEAKRVKSAQILASRFAEKLLFAIFDPTIDLVGGP